VYVTPNQCYVALEPPKLQLSKRLNVVVKHREFLCYDYEVTKFASITHSITHASCQPPSSLFFYACVLKVPQSTQDIRVTEDYLEIILHVVKEVGH
jgi:hypothetical protein